MAIFAIKKLVQLQQMFFDIIFLHLLHLYFCTFLTTIEFIGGQYVVLFTWVIIIKLVNTIWGVPITLVVAIGNALFPRCFLLLKLHLILLQIL